MMGIRDYQNLKDIIIPEAQEKIMDIFCAAWEDCRNMGHCEDCPDRQMLKERFALLECFSLKYSRMLIEAGYAPVVHGEWLDCECHNDIVQCSVCGDIYNRSFVHGHKYCNCGAKMGGDES